jgi:hypothetical protein
MNILKALRNGGRAEDRGDDSPDVGHTDAGQQLTDRFEGLNERQAVAQLVHFNQVELTAIEAFERTHRDRPAVINKLRYLRQPEPLAGYDALEPDAITEALSGADRTTVQAVREYERKLQGRAAVLNEITRALHRFGERPAPEDVVVPAAARDHEQPLVVGNGLPTKVRAESGNGARPEPDDHGSGIAT